MRVAFISQRTKDALQDFFVEHYKVIHGSKNAKLVFLNFGVLRSPFDCRLNETKRKQINKLASEKKRKENKVFSCIRCNQLKEKKI